MSAETSPTPLQEKLDVLANQIGNFGMLAAALTFVAMIALWFIRPEWRDPEVQLHEFVLKAFIMGVTIVVVAVPEGLPLAVTLSLAYSTQKMMHDNNLIRVLAACETMGNATNICSDKTGTLTQNRMTVVEAWLAGKLYNSDSFSELKSLDRSVVHRLCEGSAVNSTANVQFGPNGSEVTGSKTEGALLIFTKEQFQADYMELRSHFSPARGDRLITFSSARKRMSVVLRDAKNGTGGVVYTKGASEIVLDLCSHVSTSSGGTTPLTETIRREILEAISCMAKNALRTVAIAHRTMAALPAGDDAADFEKDLVLDAIVGIKDPLRPDVPDAVRKCQEAGIFVRMVTGDNIETAKAIAKECGILTEGGIAMEGPDFRRLTPDQLDVVLPLLQVLARSSPDDKHTLVTRLNGKNLPDSAEAWEAAHPGLSFETDKDKVLPGYLEEWTAKHAQKNADGEVVGVTGDGTNDGPALKAADVGLSMGLSGTDGRSLLPLLVFIVILALLSPSLPPSFPRNYPSVCFLPSFSLSFLNCPCTVAKEASDIVILDDNFSSIVKSVLWGRAVFDNIRKFLQFQLTVNVVALTLTFLSALTGKEPPLNAVMMLWVNLIMDTLGALALGTEPPASSLLYRRPYRRAASLISNKMVRNIGVQFLFQLATLSYLLLRGAGDFGVEAESREHITIIFNTFVFCQIFNELNARSIGDKMNVFHNLHRNVLFISILLFTAIAQVFIVEYGGDFVRTAPLTADHWVKCISLGALSLPLGGLMRCIPVVDRESDYAALAPLMQANYESEKKKKRAQQDKAAGNQLELSFLVWFAAVAFIPAFAYQQFAAQWGMR